MLYILNEMGLAGYKDLTLVLLSVIAIFLGISVIISKNPIISVLFLIGLFLDISCYLILIGLTFIGLAYLLVYVGAVSILFLFILMLINVRISELFSESINNIPSSIILGSFFYFYIDSITPYIAMTHSSLLLFIGSIKKLALVTSVF
jgi:NADH-ubiquinone oxidoreductase chain 6